MSRIKIQFKDPDFFVNKDKRTVTCKLRGFIQIPKGTYHVWEDTFYAISTATAKCSPEDEFDIERGKRISLAKAENKIFKKAESSLLRLADDVKFTLISIETYSRSAKQYIRSNQRYIQSTGDASIPVKPLNRGFVRFSGKKKESNESV